MNCCLLDITSGKSYRLLFSQRVNNGLFIVLSFASYYSGTSCAGDAPYIAIEPSGVCVYDFFDDQPSYAVYSCDASGKHDYLSVLQVCCLTYKFIDTTVTIVHYQSDTCTGLYTTSTQSADGSCFEGSSTSCGPVSTLVPTTQPTNPTAFPIAVPTHKPSTKPSVSPTNPTADPTPDPTRF
jgi:hypothetical protein